MRFAPALCAVLLAAGFAAAADTPAKPPTALSDYVTKEDKSFEWKIKEKKDVNGATVYTLSLTSQTWHDIAWTHDLQVTPYSTMPSY